MHSRIPRCVASACAGLLLALCAARTAVPQSGTTYSWLGQYALRDGTSVNPYWTCLWLGYGTGSVSSGQLWLMPRASTSPGETHSALVRSNFPLPQAGWAISVRVATDAQLRTAKGRKKKDPVANPWEVAWLIAGMADDGSSGLYFMLKPNGVELGAYAMGGAQRVYLFTSGTPTLVLGQENDFRLVNDGLGLTALLDGSPVASAPLTALSGWPLGNKIGLYSEDAAVRFGPVTVAAYP